jgi:hypothetical protein
VKVPFAIGRVFVLAVVNGHGCYFKLITSQMGHKGVWQNFYEGRQ